MFYSVLHYSILHGFILLYSSQNIMKDQPLITQSYSVILSVLDPRKCEYLKDYSLDFEHAYMTTYLQRICGSTWWWRAPKRLFSAGWSHLPLLDWEHDRNRKLCWWPDYFERLMAAKISWLKSARFVPVGRLKRKSLCQQATHHTGTVKYHSTWNRWD